jgi:hypothetical protein
MVSLWICIRVALFDLRSAGAGAGAGADLACEPPPPEGGCCDDAPAAEGGDGSEVMRSISVEPDEPCPEDMAAGVVGSRPCASEISGEHCGRGGEQLER